jgi:hypothetical protein
MNETPEQAMRWFHAAVQKLTPVAAGSLSLRKSPCIGENCAACASGEGYSSYVLGTVIRAGAHSAAPSFPILIGPSTLARAAQRGLSSLRIPAKPVFEPSDSRGSQLMVQAT